MDLAAAVAKAVDITDVRMVEMHSKHSRWEGKAPALRRMGHTANTKRSSSGDSIIASVEMYFEMAEDTDESKDEPPLIICATFDLNYRVENLRQFSDEQVQAFGTVNGAYNAWPFWRELVYTTLSRMGVPPVTLPVFRVLPADKSASKDDA